MKDTDIDKSGRGFTSSSLFAKRKPKHSKPKSLTSNEIEKPTSDAPMDGVLHAGSTEPVIHDKDDSDFGEEPEDSTSSDFFDEDEDDEEDQ